MSATQPVEQQRYYMKFSNGDVWAVPMLEIISHYAMEQCNGDYEQSLKQFEDVSFDVANYVKTRMPIDMIVQSATRVKYNIDWKKELLNCETIIK